LKNVTVGTAAFITQMLAVLSITFLLVLHGRRYSEMALSLTGERQERYRQVLIDIKDSVAQYTLGNLIISALATVATWIVLSNTASRTRWRSDSWSGSSTSYP